MPSLHGRWTAIRLRLFLGRRQERLDQQADLFLRLGQCRDNMRCSGLTDACFHLAQIASCVPQSDDYGYFRKSTANELA